MKNRGRLKAFVVAAHTVALLTISARPTFAQPPPSEDETRPTLKIGPVELWPTVVFRNIGVDNNVFNDAESPKQDFTLTVAPNLEAVVRPDWMRLSYTALSEFVYFAKNKSERSVNRGFQSRFDLYSPIVQPYLQAGAMLTQERPNHEIDERARRQLRNYGGGLRFPLGTGASISVGVRRDSERFVEGDRFRGVDLGSELNTRSDVIETILAIDVTPLTTVGVTVAKEADRFDNDALRDSNAIRITPTVTFQPLGLFSGSASVGYLRFDPVDPAVAEYGGLVASGTVGVTLLDRYRIETSFGRDVRYSYDRDTPTYVWTSGRGTLRMDLFGGLDVRLTGGRDVMNYRPRAGVAEPGKDAFVVYGAGLGYSLLKMRFGVDAEIWERESGRAGRGYRNNRIMGSLNWGASPR